MLKITGFTAGGLAASRRARTVEVTLTGIVIDGVLLMRQDSDFVCADKPDRFVSVVIEPEPAPAVVATAPAKKPAPAPAPAPATAPEAA